MGLHPDKKTNIDESTRHCDSRQKSEINNGDRYRNSNLQEFQEEEIEKNQELKEEPKKMWKVKAKVIPVITGTLGTVIHKLEKWLQ